MEINIEFIRELEGGCILHGYWPPLQKSGVTIATGVDLGQQDFFELKRLGVPERLCVKFKPYFGAKGAEAEELLKHHPISITQDEADDLDFVLFNHHRGVVSRQYNQALRNFNLDTLPVWDELPEPMRTVMFSLHYNMGSLPRAAPKAWHLIVTNQWTLLQQELNNFGHHAHGLTARREREAEYLSKATGMNPTEPIPANYPWPKGILMRIGDRLHEQKNANLRVSYRKSDKAKNLERRRADGLQDKDKKPW